MSQDSKKLEKSIFISASSGMPKSQTATSVPNPAKVGATSEKTPKIKKLPGPDAKPSVFFKSEFEEFAHVKHPTLQKLRDILMKRRGKQ